MSSKKMETAASLVRMNSNRTREEIKDMIRDGSATDGINTNMDIGSVTPQDIDDLPWDDEDMTIKRCKWCHEFETDSHILMKCVACKGFNKAWYCNRDCQKKQWKYHKTWCASQQTASGIPKGAIRITPNMFGTSFGK